MSVFGVISVHIFPHSNWIRTRLTLNTETFHAVHAAEWKLIEAHRACYFHYFSISYRSLWFFFQKQSSTSVLLKTYSEKYLKTLRKNLYLSLFLMPATLFKKKIICQFSKYQNQIQYKDFWKNRQSNTHE